MSYALAKAMATAVDAPLMYRDPLPKKEDQKNEAPLDLARVIQQFAAMYKLKPVENSQYPEYFSFSTGHRAKWLVIRENPKVIQHKGFGNLPWHVAFAKQIVRNNSGNHTWTIQTKQNPSLLKVGIYFGTSVHAIKADFAHGRMPAGAETYFQGRGRHMAGINYGDGSTFGGETCKLQKIVKGHLNMKLDSSTCTLSFSKDKKNCTFLVKELSDLTRQNKPWECVMFVAIGGGGLYMNHEAAVTNYSRQPNAKM